MELLVLALAVAFLLWRVRRWPLARCPVCKGRGKFVRGRVARRCSSCGGSGYRVRWLLKMFGVKDR